VWGFNIIFVSTIENPIVKFVIRSSTLFILFREVYIPYVSELFLFNAKSLLLHTRTVLFFLPDTIYFWWMQLGYDLAFILSKNTNIIDGRHATKLCCLSFVSYYMPRILFQSSLKMLLIDTMCFNMLCYPPSLKNVTFLYSYLLIISKKIFCK